MSLPVSRIQSHHLSTTHMIFTGLKMKRLENFQNKACVHCLLFFHCTPLTRVWLWLLHTLPVATDSNQSARHPPPFQIISS